ncbi:MAG: Type secretion system protein [Candidatus Saccharibacteria bacterium]|jgi:type II secretion system protein G|nr:Type secretion system protein [Candidatus Saccharibacteria bacterium]
MLARKKASSTENNRRGFTIVELLIVIVVIGILAAITIVAYNGVQQRARDSKRTQDIAVIVKSLELYYIDNGKYPTSSGSTTINAGWSTTADASWANLASQLKTYANSLPSDPVSTPNVSFLTGGYNYSYFSDPNGGGNYCGTTNNQMFILTYKVEGSSQSDTLTGDCSTKPIYYSGVSNYRVRK